MEGKGAAHLSLDEVCNLLVERRDADLKDGWEGSFVKYQLHKYLEDLVTYQALPQAIADEAARRILWEGF